MRSRSFFATLSVLAAGAVLACSNAGGEQSMQSEAQGQASSDAAVGSAVTSALTSQFETVSGHLLAAAEQVPEEQYSFAPTEEVRDLGGILLHVAQAHYMFCSTAAGEEPPAAAQQEPSGKAGIVEMMRSSREYCLQVYRGTSGDALAETASIFGNETTRGGVMISNFGHDQLHYGNIVTYMRSIDMVPPSSQ